jgi:hypothetical protein
MQSSHNAKMRNAVTSANGNAKIQSRLLSRLTAKYIQMPRDAMEGAAEVKPGHALQPNFSSLKNIRHVA